MSIESPEARMQKSGAFWMALIGFALLGAVVMLVAVPGIERELAARSAAALRNFDWVSMDVDGRTLILTGVAPDQTSWQALKSSARQISPFLRLDDRTALSSDRITAPEMEIEPDRLPVRASAEENGAALDPDQTDSQPPVSAPDVPAETTMDPVVVPEPEPAVASAVEPVVADPAASPPVDVPPAAGVTATKQQVPVSECQARLDSAMRAEVIRFQSGSTEILPASLPLLKDISRVALGCHARIEVSGHTDDLGEDAENLTLSLQRAQAVVDFLVSQGVRADMLAAKGYGEAFPVQPNTTWAGRKANRRIAFKVLQEGPLQLESSGQESP